ncbi:ABC transporter substrate binding protein, partial [Treponema sp. UBA3813]|uniref:ABC transporter substrate-binding protein n=1 Tax=Treponema sp. UBA3813 TaxID=1947715 RepID=UPI0025D7F012
MKATKSLAVFASALALFAFAGCNKKTAATGDIGEKTYKIGIAKIVQHVALDSVEQGVIDVLKENGINATYDLQNANGDPNTASQIALKYKDERVDVAVGIATPVALAMANTIDDIPIVFGTVTDPLGAG